MKLLLENWRKYRLLTEAEDIYVLYESQIITEAEFMDRIKKWAQRKGIPLAVALSLATGAMAPPAYAADTPTEEPTQHTHDAVSEDWMRFGKGTAFSPSGASFVLYHNGSDRDGDDATIVFLKGMSGRSTDYLYSGKGEIIGFAQRGGEDARKMPIWKPHWHAPSSGYAADAPTVVEFSASNHINSSLYELPSPVK